MLHGVRILLALLPIIFSSYETPLDEKDRSGPTIKLQSTVYQVGEKWLCPLCRQEVPHGSRAGWDHKLALSEWHDVLIERSYFEKKIRYITDEELVNSLAVPSIDGDLRKALAARRYARVSDLLHRYVAGKRDNGRLSTYDPQNKKFFITTEEFLSEVRRDTARRQAIVRSEEQIFTPAKGFTLYGVPWGKKIDFNHSYPNVSKYGVHYLSFLDNLIADFLVRRDPATAAAFESLFNQWYDQLDSIRGEDVPNQITVYDVVWYELGLANRTQRLIDAHRVFARYVSPETNKKLLKIILGSSRWLDQCLAKTPFHPYNWQTHTAMTLSYAALVYPEFRESDSWLERGRKRMVQHLENDIKDDGGYIERTPSYAEYMFTVFYRYMMMLQYFKNDPSLKDAYLGRLEKYIEFFVLTNTPVGVNTPFNDAGRGKGLVRMFKEMGEFFNRSDFIGAVRHEFSPEEISSMPFKITLPATTSVDFPNSQFVVMRDSWDPESYFLILNYGEWQNHSHYDHLDFEIYANGIPVALDAGIGKLGYLDSMHVSWYKHPLSHNMVTINQAVPEKMNMRGYDKVWSPMARTDVFAATHDGYLKYQKAKHRRHVIFAKKLYWLIVDDVVTTGRNQDMEFNFHTPSTMVELPDGFISRGEKGFLIKQDWRDAQNFQRIRSAGSADLKGLPNEPSHREIDWLIFRKGLSGNPGVDRMVTLIYPFASSKGIDPTKIAVERVDAPGDSALVCRVTTPEGQDLIIISDGSYRTFIDGIEGDFLYARISMTDKVEYAGFTGVSRYKIRGLEPQAFEGRRDHEYRK
jgi:hypothetical protein